MAKSRPPKHKTERGELVKFPDIQLPKELEETLARLREQVEAIQDHPAIKQMDEMKARMEKLVDEMKANPNYDGWLRLCEILEGAKDDERIKTSAGASDFLELMLFLASDAVTASSADGAIQPLVAAIKTAHSSDMAIKRFTEERKAKAWVISEWTKYKSEYGGNKSEFARHYAKRVFHEFDVDVKERNIKERWLRGL